VSCMSPKTITVIPTKTGTDSSKRRAIKPANA
jgi:hypothetical protein